MNRTIKDCVYGLAVGDALGVPFEFRPRNTFNATDMTSGGVWNQTIGTWSDDTSMTIATCDALKENNKKIDLKAIQRNFVIWKDYDAYTAHNNTFDVGNTTAQALDRRKGLDDLYSNGNGSLMRIAPLIFIDCTDEEIAQVSAITHSHQYSIEACILYVKIGKELLKGKDLKTILDELDCSDTFTRLKNLKNLDRDSIQSSGYVVHTLEASLWSILNNATYSSAVLTAVNLGDDTDTTAAVTGALAGIIYGYEEIPKEWIDKLANKELIDSCLL